MLWPDIFCHGQHLGPPSGGFYQNANYCRQTGNEKSKVRKKKKMGIGGSTETINGLWSVGKTRFADVCVRKQQWKRLLDVEDRSLSWLEQTVMLFELGPMSATRTVCDMHHKRQILFHPLPFAQYYCKLFATSCGSTGSAIIPRIHQLFVNPLGNQTQKSSLPKKFWCHIPVDLSVNELYVL